MKKTKLWIILGSIFAALILVVTIVIVVVLNKPVIKILEMNSNTEMMKTSVRIKLYAHGDVVYREDGISTATIPKDGKYAKYFSFDDLVKNTRESYKQIKNSQGIDSKLTVSKKEQTVTTVTSMDFNKAKVSNLPDKKYRVSKSSKKYSLKKMVAGLKKDSKMKEVTTQK